MRLINKYKTNQIIQRDGFGPFRAAGLLSFLNQSCTTCESKINTLALGNALEITEQGVVFLCMQCRNVEHNLTPEEIKEHKDADEGYFNLETDSFKEISVDQYKIVSYLDSNYHAHDYSYAAYDPILSIDVVMYLRKGVYGALQGALQQGEYSSNWVAQADYSSFYNNWDKLTNCPECGGFLRNNFHSPYQTEIEAKNECPHCAISIDAFWNYRNTLESDIEKLVTLIKFDIPEKKLINERTLETINKRTMV